MTENLLMKSFVVRTSNELKKNLDRQIAKAIYATNSSFRCIEQPEVIKAIEMLRPGYSPPSRFAVSSTLLNEVYMEEKEKCLAKLTNSSVCLSLDGWSNVHNEPIICATVTTDYGSTFLLESIDTSGHAHTADYLTSIAISLINKCKTQYNCAVSSFVTDNAANMSKMRENIKNEVTDVNVITYGCSAHILNLLSKDLQIRDIKENVVHVVKYFRNNHLASAKYKAAGGKALILPQDVRWNTLADCLEIFTQEWQKLLQICEENKDQIDSLIFQKVSNIKLKRSAEDFLKIIKPISVTLDKLQRTDAFLADAVEAWKELEAVFDDTITLNIKQMAAFQKRYAQALTPYHFLAYLLDPRKTKFPLKYNEKDAALKVAAESYPHSGLLPIIIKFEAKSDPFKSVMFSEEIINNVTPIQWWKSQKDVSDINKVLPILTQLMCSVTSSASVERIFSTFGLVHSTIRNKLGTEKAAKLVFLFQHYNTKNL